ncbi:MAG: hypothetical protein ACRDHG_14345 [Anaerolineales bacterium]
MTKLVEQLIQPEILTLLRQHSGNREIWLVGGALRDHFLGRPQPDLDFVVDREAAGLARLLSEDLRAGYYSLDDERDAARVILPDQAGTLDFVRRSGASIETDLRERDFTINALALPLEGDERLIDPLGGLQDLKDRRLRPCSEDAVLRDPVRALRAVRLAVQFGLHMEPETVLQVRAAGERLSASPAERVRGEFMKLLDPSAAGTAIRLMDHLGLLIAVCPELDQLPGSEGAGRARSLTTLERLAELLEQLGLRGNIGRARNLAMAEVALQLGRFRTGLSDHFQRRIRGGRLAVQLLGFAALYSRGEGAPQATGSGAAAGAAALAERRGLKLRLSRPEAGRIRAIVLNHWRPAELAYSGAVGDGEVYRFFRATGEAGIEVVLLYLAASLSSLGSAPPPGEWKSRIGIARTLFEAWFDRGDQVVRPRKLIAGDELAGALGLQAGSVIGELLEAIREAQAEGRVHDRESAIQLARVLLESGRARPRVERASKLRDKSL